MATVLERVKKITGSVLNIDPATIKETAHFSHDLGAESVQSIELVAAFSEDFDIEMDEEQALQVTTVKGAVDYISKVCKEQGKPV
ncbi:MAG: acyl carrier protein [Planctomycetota bacterium]